MEQISITLEKLSRFAPALPFTANQLERIADTFAEEAPRMVNEMKRFVDVCESLKSEYSGDNKDTVEQLLDQAAGFFNSYTERQEDPK